MEQSFIYHQEWPVQIRFNDIDLLGHVNNATIQEYFDLGRMYYLNLVFDGQIDDKQYALIIASIHTDFLIPVFLKDTIRVQTKIFELGNKSLKMIQQLTGENDSVKATCQSVMVCFNKQNHESEVIPDSWREKIKEVEKGDLRVAAS